MTSRMKARIRLSLVGAASAALVLGGCGKPPQTELDPAAVPVAPIAPEVGPVVEPTPEVEDEATDIEGSQRTPTATATPRASRSSTPTPAPKTSLTSTPTPTPTAQAGQPIMKAGQTSERIKELQARLVEAGWFTGSLTGHYGPQTSTAVAGFQAKRGLPDTGQVDQATWVALLAMTRQPTAAELEGQAKATPTPSSTAATPRAGDKAGEIDQRCMTGRVICISKRTNMLRWINDGNVLMTMEVRFGTSEYPTREGVFSVQWKSRDHVSTIYHTPMPYALFFSGGQAVHYSPDFAARGYDGGSHGCVNLRNKGGAQSLFNQARVGDRVVVHQ